MVKQKITDLDDHHDIGWLRVNMKPIKNTLITFSSKWIWTFTKYLSEQVC